MAKQILVVDANLAVQKLLEFSLTREGFEVLCCSDGLSALDAAFKAPPVMFLINNSPEGITLNDLLEKIRRRDSLKKVPIILLLNAGDHFDGNRAGSLGVVDSIKKPLDPIELVEKVKTYAQADETETIVTAIEQHPLPRSEENEEPEDDMVKIEELLGWTSSSEESPFSEISGRKEAQDQEKVEVEIEPQVKNSDSVRAIQPTSAEKEEFVLFEEDTPEPPASSISFSAHPSTENLPSFADETLIVSSAEEEKTIVQPASTQPTSARETLPDDRHQVETMARQMIQEVVQKVSQEMVEKIAWEVIPPLAEATIKKEIDRIMGSR